jgi:hypothetical protein
MFLKKRDLMNLTPEQLDDVHNHHSIVGMPLGVVILFGGTFLKNRAVQWTSSGAIGLADSGGKIRHPEFRTGSALSRLEKEEN